MLSAGAQLCALSREGFLLRQDDIAPRQIPEPHALLHIALQPRGGVALVGGDRGLVLSQRDVPERLAHEPRYGEP